MKKMKYRSSESVSSASSPKQLMSKVSPGPPIRTPMYRSVPAVRSLIRALWPRWNSLDIPADRPPSRRSRPAVHRAAPARPVRAYGLGWFRTVRGRAALPPPPHEESCAEPCERPPGRKGANGARTPGREERVRRPG
ncbi:hypothetical protein STTU_2049 [Streptomyces sp. Tu6071]|nr:hypothetical protein STTU_2049 [Streptomyces sp. Tu6071]